MMVTKASLLVGTCLAWAASSPWVAQAAQTNDGDLIKWLTGGGALSMLAFVVYRLVAVEMPANRKAQAEERVQHQRNIEALLARYDRFEDAVKNCPAKQK